MLIYCVVPGCKSSAVREKNSLERNFSQILTFINRQRFISQACESSVGFCGS